MPTAAQKAAAAAVEAADVEVEVIEEGEFPPTQHANVVAAWNAVLRDMPAIHKDNRMQGGGGYNFRSIEQFTGHASVLLAKHGVIVIPRCREIEYIEVGKTNNGAVIIEARGIWDWDIYGPGGITDVIHATSAGQGRDTSDKAANKAATAAFKYLLMPALMISDSKEDPEHERPEAIPDPEPSPEQQVQLSRYGKLMERAKKMKGDLPEKYIEALRAEATNSGFETVNAWGIEHLDEFEKTLDNLEAMAKAEAAEQADGPG